LNPYDKWNSYDIWNHRSFGITLCVKNKVRAKFVHTCVIWSIAIDEFAEVPSCESNDDKDTWYEWEISWWNLKTRSHLCEIASLFLHHVAVCVSRKTSLVNWHSWHHLRLILKHFWLFEVEATIYIYIYFTI